MSTLCLHILTESPLVHHRPMTVRQYNAIPHRSPSPRRRIGPQLAQVQEVLWIALPLLLCVAPPLRLPLLFRLPLLMCYHHCLPHPHCCCYYRNFIICARYPPRPQGCCCFCPILLLLLCQNKVYCCIFPAEDLLLNIPSSDPSRHRWIWALPPRVRLIVALSPDHHILPGIVRSQHGHPAEG